jgi:hypothetical protein
VDEPTAPASSTWLAWFARDIADLRDPSRFRASHGCDPNVEKLKCITSIVARPHFYGRTFKGLFEARRCEMR